MPGAVDVPYHEAAQRRSRFSYLGDKLITPVVVTALGAALTATIVPRISDRLQTHQEQLDVRTTLASKMSTAYADAVVSVRMVVRGQVYAPTTDIAARRAASQAEYNRTLRDWTIASTDLGAQLRARYPDAGLATSWRRYADAVRGYIRLGSVTTDRAAVRAALQSYARTAPVSWEALARAKAFKSDPLFLTAYDALGAWLLSRGDALVTGLLTNRPVV